MCVLNAAPMSQARSNGTEEGANAAGPDDYEHGPVPAVATVRLTMPQTTTTYLCKSAFLSPKEQPVNSVGPSSILQPYHSLKAVGFIVVTTIAVAALTST